VGPIEFVHLSEDTLPIAGPWFEDEQTQRWLGGPGWPALVLRLAADPPAEYRGRRVTGRFAWLARANQTPVGLAEIERYADATAGLALVVGPGFRGRGVGRRIIEAVLARPELAATEVIRAGIQPENTASVRCFTAAGFTAEADAPDEQGVVYFRRIQPRRKFSELTTADPAEDLQ
jgi:RimJ/RimL family protein N-acetyltransferase